MARCSELRRGCVVVKRCEGDNRERSNLVEGAKMPAEPRVSRLDRQAFRATVNLWLLKATNEGVAGAFVAPAPFPKLAVSLSDDVGPSPDAGGCWHHDPKIVTAILAHLWLHSRAVEDISAVLRTKNGRRTRSGFGTGGESRHERPAAAVHLPTASPSPPLPQERNDDDGAIGDDGHPSGDIRHIDMHSYGCDLGRKRCQQSLLRSGATLDSRQYGIPGA